MRWIAFAILLYLAAVLQTTLAPFVDIQTIRPDFMLILAVHYALMAARWDAPLACWFIGLTVDLTGLSYAQHSSLGVNAFAFGLIGLLIVRIREFTFRESPMTPLFVAFIAKSGLSLIVGLHMLYVLEAWPRWREVIWIGLWSAVYSAVLAPYFHWLLGRLRKPLGFELPRGLRVG